jgi:sugar-specific transcriptional regulator TrmB
MDTATSLSALGLTDIETIILVHLVKNGASGAPVVIGSLGLDKSTFYKAIKSLEEYGLVEISGTRRMQTYQAASTQKILAYQRSREDQVKEAGNVLAELAHEAEKYETSRFKNANVQIFEGENAYFDFMEETLKGDVKLIRDLDAGSVMNAVFAGSEKRYLEYLSGYVPRRIKMGIPIKVLIDSMVPDDERDRTDPAKLKEARQYSKPLKFSCFLNTFGDRSGFLTLRNKTPWALIIRDPIITSMLNVLFDAIWEQSVPR